MTDIRYVTDADRDFWFSLDKHLPETEFENKVRTKTGYVLTADGRPTGLLRYNLFWDTVPFCTLLYIESGSRGKGFGSLLMERWEKDMKLRGYGILLTSSQADETAQHFYRKLGYKDCGGLIIDIPEYAQPMEIFFIKAINAV